MFVLMPVLGLDPNSAGGAVFIAGLTWVLIEQIPERVDRAVDARLYLSLGGTALFPLLGDMADDILGTSILPEPLTLPAVGFGILGLIVIETGRKRRARDLRAQETVRLQIEMTESSRRLFVLSAVSAFAGAGVVRFLAGEAVGIPLIIGAVVGTLIGLFLVDTQEVDLFVLDRGLIVAPRRRFGVSIVSWRRVRRVSTTGRSLHIERGLPWPTRYERAFLTDAEAQQARDTLRRCRRAGES
jgi:hypothetical protein